jgi:ATP-binding cassette subfamily F protein 3
VLEQSAVVLKNVGFKYPGSDTELFSKVDISVDGTSRIVLLGENGAGKTTLVNVLMGGLEATTGTVERDRRARIHLVNQHHADQVCVTLFSPGACVVDWIFYLAPHSHTR